MAPFFMALESQLNAVMIEEGHYTVGETKKGRHNDAGDEKRTKAVVSHLIYKMYSSGEQFSARSRCVNYPKLEGVCHKYNSKEI